ncbi:hypothetical protein [Sinosporangium siamense]|uniref:Activator of Hsp90 ATPase homolog 1-like protein n=1 Tax=Sinosporangium siamense TaxID=1367973 RepID=A0A919VDN3_9ACTN|nr:hypothetical protein [Sinosporangium siamense]GII94309.1 hypothetical protein Ssi02_45400 [Sinosporangium siamense]
MGCGLDRLYADPSILRFELEADGEDACRLTFTNIFDGRDSATPLAVGWHAGLDLLAALLDGRKAESAPWEGLQAAYEHAFGSAA